jgi:hypothetical protein
MLEHCSDISGFDKIGFHALFTLSYIQFLIVHNQTRVIMVIQTFRGSTAKN